MRHRVSSKGKQQSTKGRGQLQKATHGKTEANFPHVVQVWGSERLSKWQSSHVCLRSTPSTHLWSSTCPKEDRNRPPLDSKIQRTKVYAHKPICPYIHGYVRAETHSHPSACVYRCVYFNVCVLENPISPHQSHTSTKPGKTKLKQRRRFYLLCPTSRCIRLCWMNYWCAEWYKDW